jgi:MioC protein
MMSEIQTHDYTQRHWGHDYAIRTVVDQGQRLRMSGWGGGIRQGDYLLLENGGGSTRYRVDTIRYESNPLDMWHIEAEFAPR